MCGTCLVTFTEAAANQASGAIFADVIENGDFGDTIGTAQTISVSDDVYGTISSESDADYLEITLEAGKEYTFTVLEDASEGTPLGDSWLGLYNSSGTLVASDDDGGIGANPFNSLITFTPSEGGTYYIRVDESDLSPLAGYSQTGDYVLTIDEGIPPPPSGDSPLEALDWNYTAPSTINVYIPSATHTVSDGTTYPGYINSDPFTTKALQSYETQAVLRALDEYESVIDVEFNVVNSLASADFAFLFSSDKFVNTGPSYVTGYWSVGGGSIRVDGANYGLDGWTVMNSGTPWYGSGALAQGGQTYQTLLHELGHGMGMAHPHDSGGGSAVMDGVSSSASTGEFGLNQNIWSVMSYNDGWEEHPDGNISRSSYGNAGGLMALDIAYLQSIYGANTAHAGGDDVYVLDPNDGAGTWYEAIWDTGGTDTIRVGGGSSLGATINLNVATLDYSATGGGYVSHHDGVHGGFTIAAGVTIENAIGGGGDDEITGNDAANVLEGNAGKDLISGGDGEDTLVGGSGEDILRGNALRDVLKGGNGADLLEGQKGDDRILGQKGDDKLEGGGGDDRLDGGLGNDRHEGGSGADTFVFTADWGRDRINDWEDGIDTLFFAADSGASGLADLKISANGKGHAVITLDADPDNVITIVGAAGQIGEGDFEFG